MPRNRIAAFEVDYLQVLDETGRVDKKLEPDLSDDQLRTMYRWMRLSRALDERMLKLQRQGRSAPSPPTRGKRPSPSPRP